MRVAKGRVCDEQLLLFGSPLGEFPRAHFQKQLARAPWRRAFALVFGRMHRQQRCFEVMTFDLWIAVNDDISQKSQQLRGAVPARFEVEEFGVVSISVVVAWPERNTGLAMTFSRNGMFVLTPRMRNSRNARSIRCNANSKSRP